MDRFLFIFIILLIVFQLGILILQEQQIRTLDRRINCLQHDLIYVGGEWCVEK